VGPARRGAALAGRRRAWRATHIFRLAGACRVQAAAIRMKNPRTKGGLEDMLRAMVLGGEGTPRRLKTFIVELDGPENPVSNSGGIWWDSRPSGTDGVSIVTCHDFAGGLPACEVLLDRRPGRFCLAHMAEEDGAAGDVISAMARTTQVNRAWVCPSVLRGLAGVRGGNGDAQGGLVKMRRADGDGQATTEVGCDGTVTHAGGRSVGAHLRMAGDVLAASARMCANAERFRIGAVDACDGVRFGLAPIVVRLSRRISDVGEFVRKTLDGAPPLLMRGSAIRVEGDQYSVPTMDIECGHYMGMDITPEAVHVGLHRGCSGCGVLRLLACLQMRHDPALVCDQVTAGACSA